MPKLAKIAAGWIAFVAHAGTPPPGTQPLNEYQEEEVEQVIGRIDAETPFIQKLLEKADPLFDLDRKRQSDNSSLIVGIGELQREVHWLNDNEHIVVLSDVERVDKNNFIAEYVENDILSPWQQRDYTDGWIVLEPDPNSPSFLEVCDPNTLMHEAAHHYFFRGHKPVVSDTETLENEVKYRDPSYLVGNLYDFADDISRPEAISYGRAGFELYPEYLFTELRRAVEAGNDYNGVDIIDEVALQKEISKRADAMLKQYKISREEWIDERVATFGAKTTGGEWTYDSQGVGHHVATDSRLDELGMTKIGITIDEVREALEESPELFELRNQGFKEAFEDLENNFPDQYYEWQRQSERQKELAAEKKGGVKRR